MANMDDGRAAATRLLMTNRSDVEPGYATGYAVAAAFKKRFDGEGGSLQRPSKTRIDGEEKKKKPLASQKEKKNWRVKFKFQRHLKFNIKVAKKRMIDEDGQHGKRSPQASKASTHG